jgi:hypothetical protein
MLLIMLVLVSCRVVDWLALCVQFCGVSLWLSVLSPFLLAGMLSGHHATKSWRFLVFLRKHGR